MEIRKTLIVERLRLFRRRRDGVMRRANAGANRHWTLRDLQQGGRRGRRRMRMRRLSERQGNRWKSHRLTGYPFQNRVAGAAAPKGNGAGRRKQSSQTEQRSKQRTNGAEVRRAPQSGAD